MRSRRRPAFTLLEMVLVCAIMVIFAAISYPAIEAMYADTRLQGASDAVRAAWSEAQCGPSTRAAPTASPSSPARGTTASPPTVPSSGAGEGGTAMADPDNPAYILENSLPKGMVFPDEGGNVPNVSVSDSSLPDGSVGIGQWVTQVTFLPDGTAQDDAEVFLQYPGTRPITLRLRPDRHDDRRRGE